MANKKARTHRKTGEAILRFKDTKGSLVAVRLRPGQFRTLANGVLGLAEARGESLPMCRAGSISGGRVAAL